MNTAQQIPAATPPASTSAGAAASRPKIAALLVLCLLAFIPGFFALPPVDRDESRFAQASRQMFESVALSPDLQDPARHGGGFLVPMVQDRERLNKPPVIYWLQAGSAAILTAGRPWLDAVWMYRIPSLLAGFAIVLLTWRIGRAIFDTSTGAIAGAMIAVSPVFAWEAHQARADMVMLAFTLAAQLALWEVFSRSRSGQGRGMLPWAVVFWVAVAAGIMTKGPITPMVAAFTALGLSAVLGRWRWMLRLRPELGVLILVAAVLPWVWGVAQQVGWDVYIATIRAEVFDRSMTPQEGHWGPPGYHLALLLVLFWPGVLLTAAGIGLALRGSAAVQDVSAPSKQRWGIRTRFARLRNAEPGYIFLLAWIIPAWIVFELVSTKLPHYTMPLYPAIAILSAHALFAAQAGLTPGVRRRGGRIGFIVWMAVGAGFVIVGVLALSLLVIGSGWSGRILFGLVGAAYLTVAIIYLKQARLAWYAGKFARAQLAGIVVALATIIVVIGLALPRLIDLSPAIVREIDRVDPAGTRPIGLVRYHEDSMIFLTRGRAERIRPLPHEPGRQARDDANAAALAHWLAANPRGLAVVPKGLRDGRDWPYIEVASFAGFNYAKGKYKHLLLIEKAD